MDARQERRDQLAAREARKRVGAWLQANGIDLDATLRSGGLTVITRPDGTRAIRHTVRVPGTDDMVRERRETPLTVELAPEDWPMPMFRKKPTAVEAREFTDMDSYLAIVAWWKTWKTETLDATEKFEFRGGPTALMLVNTPDGWMSASPGDWLIRGAQDELYPYKRATYEPAKS